MDSVDTRKPIVAIRDAVFGVQDGLVSTLGALTGIAEGSGERGVILLAGLVIVTVESLSMSAGSYLSSKAQLELHERRLREELESIKKNPEGERREVREMYGRRGYTTREVALIERRLFSDEKLLLEDMAHKELGIVPEAMERPGWNAAVMGVAYVLGGSIPVLPYFFLPVGAAMAVSIAGTVLALFLAGGLKGWMVGRSWWRSGLEMLVVAGAAALAGYGIGRAFQARSD